MFLALGNESGQPLTADGEAEARAEWAAADLPAEWAIEEEEKGAGSKPKKGCKSNNTKHKSKKRRN